MKGVQLVLDAVEDALAGRPVDVVGGLGDPAVGREHEGEDGDQCDDLHDILK